MCEMASLRENDKVFVEEEYSAQFHDVSFHTVHENVLKTLRDTIDEALDGLLTYLRKICPECDLESAHSAMKTKFDEAVDKHSLGILELIQKTVAIPSNILLPEDDVQKQQYFESDVEDLQKRNLELKKRVFCNSKLKCVLTAELECLEHVDKLNVNLATWDMMCKEFQSEIDEINENVKNIDSLFRELEINFSAKKRSSYFIKKIIMDEIGEG